jgi:orotate phosphoribosyltransferase
MSAAKDDTVPDGSSTIRAGGSAMELLREVGAVLEGHFQYASGRHGPLYVEKFRLLEDPVATTRLCGMLAEHFADAGAEVVVGPTTGGVMLAFETGRQMGLPNYFAESVEDGEGREFRRGFQFRPGQRTLVVDDVLTTGGSLRDTIEAVRAAGGDPVGVGVIVDRSGGRTEFGLPFFGCMTLDIESFDAEDCPLCADPNGPELTIT